MPVPVAAAIELTDDERARLEAWARRRTSAQGLAQGSRIVLAAAEGLRNTEIAQRIGVTRPRSPSGATGSPSIASMA